jgi:hypothetical protein
MKNILNFKNLIAIALMLLTAVMPVSGQSPLYSGVLVSDAGSGNSLGQANTSRNVAVDAQGNIGVVYVGSQGLRFAKSTNRGQSFQSSVKLSDVTSGDCEVNVADNGNIYVVYSNGSQISLFTSLDGGATFSAPNVIGSGGVPHVASYGSNVYVVPQPGSPIYRNANNGVGSFSSVNVGGWVFSDIRVDKANGDVYMIADNPTLFMYRSTNSGASFTNVSISGSVFYSSYTITTGPLGKYIYVSGSGTDGYRIDFSNGSSTHFNFGNNVNAQGRTLESDEFGNFVDGYASGSSTMSFKVSNNQGNSFGSAIDINNAVTHNIARNAATQDIVVVYQGTDGKIYLNVYPGLLIGLTVSNVAQSFCPGSTGTITYKASGGTFNSGNQFIAQLSDANRSFASPTVIGSVTSTATTGTINITIPNSITSGSNYRIRVVSTNNASNGADNGFDIPVNPTPAASINASGPLSFCSSSNVTLTALGAPPGSTYLWSNGGTTQAVTVNQSGNYSVKVTNACGVSATSSSVSVNVTQGPDPTISASGPLSFCAGGSVTINVASVSGYSYQWKKDGNNISGANGTSITVDASGVYSVFISAPGGCSDNSSVTVNVSQAPAVTLTASASTINYGDAVTLSASVSSTKTYFVSAADLVNAGFDCGSGSRYGSSNPGFKWNDIGSGGVTNVQIRFNVGVECHNGAQHTSAINSFAGPTYNQTSQWCDCTPPSGDHIVTLNFSNPSGYAVGGENTFAITNSNTALGFFPTSTLSGYYAEIVVTYGSGGTVDYDWTPGNLTTSSITVSPTSTTTYSLTAKNAIGCATTVTKTITVIPPPIFFTLSKTNTTCPNGNDGTVTVNVSGGTSAVQYSLDGGTYVNSNVFTGLTAGTYSVKVKDGALVLDAQDISVSSNADNAAPEVHTQDITLYLDATGSASTDAASVNNGSTDQCGIASYSLSKTNFDCSNMGTNSVSLSVTDVNNNTGTGSATVYVRDSIKPTVVTRNLTVYLDASGAASITADSIDNGSFDNCSIGSRTLSKSSFDCSNTGVNTVTMTVTDANGNMSSATAEVTVIDLIKPTVVTQNVSVNISGGAASITAAMVNNGSSDNCAIASMSVSPSSFTCTNIGNNTVTLTVTDASGNVKTGTATVTVIGTKPTCSISVTPSNNIYTGGDVKHLYLGYGPQSLTLTASGNGGSTFSYSWSGSYLTNGSTASATFTPTAGGNYTLTCTVTNNMGCQNNCSVNICVSDIRVSGNNNVYLCHVPPGNSNNPQTLSISVNGVPAHLSNHTGDKLGSCGLTCGNNKTAAIVPEIFTEEDENGIVELYVSPNPFTGTFSLNYLSYSNETATVSIFDMTGKLVSSSSVSGYENHITLGSELAPGVYNVSFTQGNVHKVMKVSKAL